MTTEQIYIHNYRVMEKMGKGAFSTVFKGIHRVSKKTVALKVSREKQTHETKILAYLNREFVDGVPTLLWYGRFGDNTCIATTFYEATLQNYVESIWSTNFDPCLKVLGICVQLITIMDNMHSAFIVHSDIKPDNFMVDSGGHVVAIDFGLSSLYYNVEKDVYKENKQCEHLIGSPKFASYNLHVGNSISPRDDMMSLCYMMLSLFHIQIPWSNIPEQESELPLYDIRHPSNIKRAALKRDLREYLRVTYVDKYLVPYFEQVSSLEFKERPDYKSYREIFSTLY